MKKIYRKCRSRHLAISHACEVGVYLPQTSNLLDFIAEGTRTTLVEPDPKSIAAIKDYFGEKKNVTLVPVAVFDHHGQLELVQRAASTYASALPASPATINDRYIPDERDKFIVECRTFDEIDDGTIDILSVDIEGSEWYVIGSLKSRPKAISVETHGKSYVNPFYAEIISWMERNNYGVWYKDGSDTVFARRDLVRRNPVETLGLAVRNLRISFRRFKHTVKRMIHGRPRKA